MSVFYIQSEYSMLKNMIPMESLVKTAKEKGYPFLALSDEQLHGMLHFYREAQKHQIKPLLGLRLSIALDLNQTEFLVFVKNNIGYQNILKISLIKTQEKLSYDDLIAHQEGLVFIATNRSIIHQLIYRSDVAQADTYLQQFNTTFSHFYVGLSLDHLDEEVVITPRIFDLTKLNGVGVVPLHQTAYLRVEDRPVYEALIQIENENNQLPDDAQYHFLSKAEIEKRFVDYPEVFTYQKQLVELISFQWQAPKFEMPTYDVAGAPANEYLKALAVKGLSKRLEETNKNHKQYQERLLYELKIIHQMGFDHYFLIVFDFVRYAKMNDILVGPGRGSAAGSLVAYCLGITDIDPLEYDLLFERFLNPERITMPDIDLDFPDHKRDLVIRYVQEKYGKNHVISIITFGTFALRSSIRDIARVMKIDLSRVNAIIKRVLNDQVDTTDQETMRLLDVAKRIEGLPRNSGTHAAGMILSKQDLTKTIPLQEGVDGYYQSQFEATELEGLGLLKIDFLGIRNLQIIEDVVRLITDVNQNFLLKDIPLTDKKTYQLLSRADTDGVFQLESSGMKNVLTKLKPKNFEDIIALLALFRPGPMENIDEYIARRNGKAYADIHPQLEKILKPTYGIIVYQEQIMRILHEFAGYSLAEADLIRRAISKKDKTVLEKERIRFIEKCLAKNLTQQTAEEIYDLIVKFADYGFNRSHSVAYSLVAYQMAYLKANYYLQFMSVLLTHVIGSQQAIQQYVTDLRKNNILVLGPDIHRSTDRFIQDGKTILMPLTQIKSLGKTQVQKILTERNKGPFTDFFDFKNRMVGLINDRNMEMLIHSGALDGFNLTHHTMVENKKTEVSGYEKYIVDFKMQTYPEYPFKQLSDLEKDALNLNLKYHPLVKYEAYIKEHQLDQLETAYIKQLSRVLGFITRQKTIKTKQGKPMAFLTIDDGQHQLEGTLFSDNYLKYQNLLDEEAKLFTIKQNVYQGKTTFIIEKIESI